MEEEKASKRNTFQFQSCLFFIASFFAAIGMSIVLVRIFPALFFKDYEAPIIKIVPAQTDENRTFYHINISDQLRTTATELELSGLPDFPLDVNEDVKYSEIEMMKISDNLIQIISGKPDEDWMLTDLEYHLSDCNTGFDGNFHVNYHYELPVETDDHYQVTTYDLDIYPQSYFALSTTDQYTSSETPGYPHLLDEREVRVNATQAYEIIEEKGGYKIRSKQETSYCEVVITIDEEDNSKWHIRYIGTHGVMFEGTVDRQTGKFKKIRVKD